MRTTFVPLDWIPGNQLMAPNPSARRLAVPLPLLKRAIDQELTPRQRECVQLYFFRNLTMEQVGEELGIGKATVCRHLQKAKGRLSRALGYAALKPSPEP